MLTVRAELHCHTTHSDGWGSPLTCIRHARKKGLRVLAITDHDTAEGGLPYWDNPLQDGVLIIPGEEVSTDRGHVLAYFVKETIPPGYFEEVLERIREQNALAFVAHPYHIPIGNRWRHKPIFNLSSRQLTMVDGIEVINGHNRTLANQYALNLALSKGMLKLSGSDAHAPIEIGNAVTELEVGELSHQAVRDALLSGRASPRNRRFNGYPIYLLVGLMNRLYGRCYTWTPPA